MNAIRELFSSNGFMPHGFCYQWKPALVWLHSISDTLIALAYFSIPIGLIYLVRKKRSIPFDWMFVCFGIFIAACGATHLMEVVTLWLPVYWVSGGVKVITALASLPAAILLTHVVPRALNLPSAEELRAANEELRESEDRYRDLVEHSSDLICTHDANGILLSVNEAPLRILGYSREELLNKPLRDFVTPETRPLCDAYLAQVQRDGFAHGLLPVLTKSRDVRLWEYNNSLRKEGVSSPIVRGIAHDVTEQKRAEAALRKSEEKFSRAFRSSPVEMAITTLEDGRFLDVNESFERNLGYTRKEVIGPYRNGVRPLGGTE